MTRKTLSVALIGACMVAIVVALGVRLWTGSVDARMPRLSVVHVAADGRVYVMLGHTLYIDSGRHESLRTVPLSRWGIHAFVGDFAVLPNHDILLAGNDGRLERCSLRDDSCRALGGSSPGKAFHSRRSFKLAVGKGGKRLYIADTDHDRILITDSHGTILAQKTGLKLPNQIRLNHDNQVLVADTNHHRVTTYPVRADAFRKAVSSRPVSDWPGAPAQAFPLGLAVAADGALWVTVADKRLEHTALYRLPAGTDRPERVALPRHANVYFLAIGANRVLAPDRALYVIHAFSLAGKPLPDFGSAALGGKLQALARRNAVNQRFFKGSLVALFVIVGMLLFALIVRQWFGARLAASRARGRPSVARSWPAVPADAVPGLDDRAEHGFRRRLLGPSRAANRVLALVLLGMLLLVAVMVLVVTHGKVDALLLLRAVADNPRTWVVLPIVFLLSGFAWQSSHYERLYLDAEGVRYTTFLGGPLRFLAPLYPDWSISWRELADISLVTPKASSRLRANPMFWNIVLQPTHGVARRVGTLAWRAIDRDEDVRMPLFQFRQRQQTTEAAIARTLEFQLFDRMRRRYKLDQGEGVDIGPGVGDRA